MPLKADRKPFMDDGLTLLVGDLTLNQKQRLARGERAGKAHGRSLFAAESKQELEMEPLHHRMKIPEQMYVGPVALLRSGILDRLFHTFPAGGEVDSTVLR